MLAKDQVSDTLVAGALPPTNIYCHEEQHFYQDLQERLATWKDCSERLESLRVGFKNISAWLDWAQQQLKVTLFQMVLREVLI